MSVKVVYELGRHRIVWPEAKVSSDWAKDEEIAWLRSDGRVFFAVGSKTKAPRSLVPYQVYEARLVIG